MLFKRWSVISIAISIIGTALLLHYIPTRFGPPQQTPTQNADSMVGVMQNPPPDSAPHSTVPTPSSVFLKVPFTVQAPTGNWDKLHNEACEEAVSIMANAYVHNSSILQLSSTAVESEITTLTTWQDSTFGYHLDTTTTETARMMQEVYGLVTEVLPTFTEETLKRALMEQKLVIISFNGQLLHNPYYKQPGPIHHMLVITGFSGDTFITNDPGTKHGQNFSYTYDTLYTAAGDWNHHTKNIINSSKPVILVSKK